MNNDLDTLLKLLMAVGSLVFFVVAYGPLATGS